MQFPRHETEIICAAIPRQITHEVCHFVAHREHLHIFCSLYICSQADIVILIVMVKYSRLQWLPTTICHYEAAETYSYTSM